MENVQRHPSTPTSNVAKFGDYDPSKYAIINVSRTFSTNEALQPGCPPHLTQDSIAKYLTPLTRELNEVPARPTINELPDAVIGQMVKRDKAFWVDKPGVNDYVIHDSYHHYGLSTEVVKPVMPMPTITQFMKYFSKLFIDSDKRHPNLQSPDTNAPNDLIWAYHTHKLHHSFACASFSHEKQYTVGNTEYPTTHTVHQDPFPRSYQYDVDCVRYRRTHACDGMMRKPGEKGKPVSIHCRDCTDLSKPGLTPFQLTLVKDPGLKRWRYYPDLNATLTREQIKASMDSVGRPFYNEACNWYYENYPPVKYDCIVRKFSK